MGSMLPWVCTVTASNRSQQTSHQNVMGTSVTHSAAPHVPLFQNTSQKTNIYNYRQYCFGIQCSADARKEV